jgi:hypothetical protein
MTQKVIYEQLGPGSPAPPISKDTPPDCNTCQYFEETFAPGGAYDTDADARVAYFTLFVPFARTAKAKDLWNRCWANFKCPPPAKECKVQAACENTPWFIEGGAQQLLNKDGLFRWHIYFRLGRRIKCVTDGDGKDVEPKIPEFPIEQGSRPQETSQPFAPDGGSIIAPKPIAEQIATRQPAILRATAAKTVKRPAAARRPKGRR